VTSIARELAALTGPLRRGILRATRTRGSLPNLPDAQVEVLRVLTHRGPLSPSDIAEALRVAKSTVSNLLKSLQSAGLVERTITASDGRVTLISASPKAMQLLRTYDSVSEAVLDDSLARLSAAERAKIGAALPLLARLSDDLAEQN
jgi:DNA-binding MarR family transcriptional regulator